jgi:protoporphyrinogen oxidase
VVVILGGGVAGLATAYFLGDTPCVVLEAESAPGGLCRSREVDGFVFDHAGHFLHVRDERIRRWVEELLPGAFEVIERRAFIRTRGRTVPFPFQANLYGLEPEVIADCILGFVEAMGRPVPEEPETSFRDWSLAVFGRGISEAFLFPYNRKLFGREPDQMTADWVSWAVPRPTLEEVVRGAVGLENKGMGYNPIFRYPKRGGIGILPEAIARRVSNLRCGVRVTGVDLGRRRVRIAGGEEIGFDQLVVTIPLPAFLGMLEGAGAGWSELASRLDWSVVGCLNLGIGRPGVGQGAHWIYFPDPDVPFYRVGFYTNVCPALAPEGTSSLYVEFGLRRGEPADVERLEAESLEALRREGILYPGDRVLVRDFVLLDPGYVIFDRARQQVLAQLLPQMERLGVYLIGRYGAWTYSYMERAMLDGLETAARIRDRGARP